MSKTHIVVLQLKEVIYTAIFIGLGLLLVLLLFLMFRPGASSTDTSSLGETDAIYTPGVYTTQLTLGAASLNLELTVDSNHINELRLVHIDEAVETMYPLISSTVDEISQQLKNDIPLENVIFSSDHPHTQTVIMDAIDKTLKKAEVPDTTDTTIANTI